MRSPPSSRVETTSQCGGSLGACSFIVIAALGEEKLELEAELPVVPIGRPNVVVGHELGVELQRILPTPTQLADAAADGHRPLVTAAGREVSGDDGRAGEIPPSGRL